MPHKYFGTHTSIPEIENNKVLRRGRRSCCKGGLLANTWYNWYNWLNSLNSILKREDNTAKSRLEKEK